jgi:hypothetical protein
MIPAASQDSECAICPLHSTGRKAAQELALHAAQARWLCVGRVRGDGNVATSGVARRDPLANRSCPRFLAPFKGHPPGALQRFADSSSAATPNQELRPVTDRAFAVNLVFALVLAAM